MASTRLVFSFIPLRLLTKTHELFVLNGPFNFREVNYKRDVRQRREMSEFCTMLYAAQRSGIALKTWYQGGAGTDSVPRIRFGRSIRLLREDVEEFIAERIREARQPSIQKK